MDTRHMFGISVSRGRDGTNSSQSQGLHRKLSTVEQQFSIILFHSTEKFSHESPLKTDNITFSWGEIDKWMCNNLLPPILWLQLKIATYQIRNSKQQWLSNIYYWFAAMNNIYFISWIIYNFIMETFKSKYKFSHLKQKFL